MAFNASQSGSAMAPLQHSSNSSGIQDPMAPTRRTALANHPTLLVSWWCTGCALCIILIRTWGRLERAGRLLREDKIMLLSIIPLLIRMALVHPILMFGTNNIQTDGITPQDVHLHSIGSRLVLASRIFYALFIWVAKFTASEYLKRLTYAAWKPRYERILHFIRIFLIVTFFAVVIATLTECQPFSHYWQVVPDPGPRCRNGYAQLLVMGVADIVTDCVLIAFPIPIVLGSQIPMKRKLSLCGLFGLNAILIAISAYRMPAIIHTHGRQQLRSLWASIEILAAAAVSNAVVLGSFLRDRGIKRTKYRTEDRTDAVEVAAQPSINRTMIRAHWGNDSDEDLFKALRGRMDSVTSEEAAATPVTPNGPGFVQCPNGHSYSPPNFRTVFPPVQKAPGLPTHEEERDTAPHKESEQQHVSFADPGGLLSSPDSAGEGPSRRRSRSRSRKRTSFESKNTSQASLPEPQSRPRSTFRLSDVGGLLTRSGSSQSPSTSHKRASLRTRDSSPSAAPLPTMQEDPTAVELVDISNLLSAGPPPDHRRAAFPSTPQPAASRTGGGRVSRWRRSRPEDEGVPADRDGAPAPNSSSSNTTAGAHGGQDLEIADAGGLLKP